MEIVDHQQLPKLIVIVGPTASGKTKLALELAQRYDGEIISTDSRAIYRGMNIGSAKPNVDEQSLVPHHMIDIAEPDQTISLSDFKAQAITAIHDILKRDKLPFLVGGTALYIYAIIENWQIPEVPPNPVLRHELEKKDISELWHQLLQQDPEASTIVDSKNKRRIIRALEIIDATGKKFTSQRTLGPRLFDSLLIGLNPDEARLRHNIAQRTNDMLAQGLIAEVQQLLDKGYDKKLPALSGIHYKEVIDYLDGLISQDELIKQINDHDYQLTRRQLTWFKRDKNIVWVNSAKEAEQAINQFLKN